VAKDIFAQFPNRQVAVEAIRPNVLVISWSRTGHGFGEIALHVDANGLRVDSECSTPEFVKEVLGALIDQAKQDGRFE
jgi:hypothetical protein